MIDCMLYIKTNINETTIQHSQQKNVSNCQSTKIMKSILTRSKTSDNHQVKSQESTIFHDKFTKKIIKKIKKYSEMKITKKLLLFQKLIYMSSATRKKMIEQHHNDALTEHFEINKTIKLIFRNYYFSQMRQKMKKHIQQCEQCQKSKSQQHKSYEKLQSLKAFNKS